MLDIRLLPSDDDLKALVPQRVSLSNGNPLYLFHSNSVDILKLDFIFNAGGAYQPKMLCAGAVRDMLLEASERNPSQKVAEYIAAICHPLNYSSKSILSPMTVLPEIK